MARKKIEAAVLEGDTLPRDISWMYFNLEGDQQAERTLCEIVRGGDPIRYGGFADRADSAGG